MIQYRIETIAGAQTKGGRRCNVPGSFVIIVVGD